MSDDARMGELVIVDYGVGNLRNVYKAVEAAGGRPRVVNRPEALAKAAGVILPGVGAFGDAAANLRAAGFEQPLREAVSAGKPLLGICVGMQLLFDESEEMAPHQQMGVHPGLGLIPGRVVRFPGDMPGPDGKPLKVPEIGWNQLRHAGNDPLLQGIPDGAVRVLRPLLLLRAHGLVVHARQHRLRHRLHFGRAPREPLGHPVSSGEEPAGRLGDPEKFCPHCSHGVNLCQAR